MVGSRKLAHQLYIHSEASHLGLRSLVEPTVNSDQLHMQTGMRNLKAACPFRETCRPSDRCSSPRTSDGCQDSKRRKTPKPVHWSFGMRPFGMVLQEAGPPIQIRPKPSQAALAQPASNCSFKFRELEEFTAMEQLMLASARLAACAIKHQHANNKQRCMRTDNEAPGAA